MTAYELALHLDWCERDDEMWRTALEWANESGLVVVTEEDGLVRLGGALNAYSRYCNDEVFVTESGMFDERPEQDAVEVRIQDTGYEIRSVELEMDIQHSNFRILDGGEIVCVGCIFSVDEMRAGKAAQKEDEK